MADHRGDIVVEAMRSALDASLTRTVMRGREHALPDGQLPATFVRTGPEVVNPEDSAWPTAYPRLRVLVVEVAAVAAGIESTLWSMRRDSTIALRSDYTLGLAFVTDTMEENAEQIDYEGEDQSIALLRHHWTVQYMRDWDDPTQ